MGPVLFFCTPCTFCRKSTNKLLCWSHAGSWEDPVLPSWDFTWPGRLKCAALHTQGEASTPSCCQDVFTGWCLQALHLGGTGCALFVFLGTHLGLKNSFLVLAAQAPGCQLN